MLLLYPNILFPNQTYAISYQTYRPNGRFTQTSVRYFGLWTLFLSYGGTYRPIQCLNTHITAPKLRQGHDRTRPNIYGGIWSRDHTYTQAKHLKLRQGHDKTRPNIYGYIQSILYYLYTNMFGQESAKQWWLPL